MMAGTMDWTTILGIAGMALLFALVAVLPFTHRPCSDCGGDCGSCDVDDPGTQP